MESKSGQKFCLQWKDFENKISAGFKELREEKDFFDVTLACDDSQLQAHKVILGACSPFFRTILKNNPHPQPLIYLKGVKYNELDAVLKFMYEGEVNVAQDDLNTFLAVAEDLHVKGLTQASQKEQPISPSKPANNVSPYNRPGAGYTMTEQGTQHKETPRTDYRTQHNTTPRTEYETQQNKTPRKDDYNFHITEGFISNLRRQTNERERQTQMERYQSKGKVNVLNSKIDFNQPFKQIYTY